MAIRYEIHTIKNAQGTGEERHYVHVMPSGSLTPARLEAAIQEMSSATVGDVRAVLSALSYFARRELSQGRRFHVPGLGYLSLSAGLRKDTEKPVEKLTARDIRVSGINFSPERTLLGGVQKEAKFEKAAYSTLSATYDADALWQKVEAYLTAHRYLTRRIMQTEFGLSEYKAAQWLNRFVTEGKLEKEGARPRMLYFLPQT